MKFEFALAHLKSGDMVARVSWDDKYMGIAIRSRIPKSGSYPDYIYMQKVSGNTIPWLSCTEDLLAEDWVVVTK